MILVTGSTGNVGSEVCRQLHSEGRPFYALARNPDAAGKALPEGTRVRHGDFDKPQTLFDACQDIQSLFLISPASEDMVRHQCAVIDSARQAGVRHIVKLSGLGASMDAPARLPRLHAEIERHLAASGLDYTIVRPNLFMQVLLMSASTIKSDRAIYAPAGDGRISFTDVRDIASVIVEALANPHNHRNSSYDITGPEAWSYGEVANLIGESINGNVSYVAVSPDQARESMLGGGMSEWIVEAMLELFAIYRAGYGSAVTEQIREITGLSPTRLPRFIEGHRTAFA
ncbi:MAG: SDR family oxidoreductase [Aquisalimonadaceae bacterium]